MKKQLLFAIAVALSSLTHAQQQLDITLQEALDIALSESPTVKVADREITKKEYAKKETIAGMLPQISASASYNRTLKKQVMYMSSGKGGGGFESMITEPLEGLVKPVYDKLGMEFPDLSAGSSSESSSSDGGMEVGLANNWSGGFSLGMPIFAPTLYKTIQINSLDIELAVENARASRQNLVNQVSKAFYQYILSKDSYNAIKESYEQSLKNYKQIEDKYNQGLVSEYDKIRADVQVKNLKPSLVQADNAITLAMLQLKVLMGVSDTLDINPVGTLKDFESQLYGDVLSVDLTTLSNNSTLKQLEIQNEILKKTLKLNRTAYMPTLSLSASYQWNAMNEDFKFSDYKWNPYSMIGVSLSVPIFQGGKNYQKVRQTKIDMDVLNINRLNTERTLSLQAQSYLDNMKAALEEVGSNKEGVMQAKKGCDIARKRYDVGAGTILELNDAEVALIQANLAYNQSIYNFLSAKADLDLVLGKEVTDNETK